MIAEGVNRLPVIDNGGKLIGIVTRADLVRAFVRPDAEIEREIQENVLRRKFQLRAPEAVAVAVDGGRVTLGGSVDTRTEAELVSAFQANKIPNPMTDPRYYNIKTMQALNLSDLKRAA